MIALAALCKSIEKDIPILWIPEFLSGSVSFVLYFRSKPWGIVAFGDTAEASNCAEEWLIWHLVDGFLRRPLSNWSVLDTDCANGVKRIVVSVRSFSGSDRRNR